MLILSVVAWLVVAGCAWLAAGPGDLWVTLGLGLFVIWVLFAGFVVNFFRDPSPAVPAEADVVVAPAYGKVDVIEETEETEYLGGRCQRVSIFLSVFDVHVQYAPVRGKISRMRHRAGQFLNALRPESAFNNENVLVEIASAERPGERVAVRLIAGLIARRILPWITAGDDVERGERICLIQFGSRVGLYIPLEWKGVTRLGDRVRGGETVLARREATP